MRKLLLMLFCLFIVGLTGVTAQTHMIKGRILDETGQGFPGAGITVKGTQTGTVSDVNGNFQLDMPAGSNTLVIQAVGYNTQEVSATDNLIVHLSIASKELQGAVVTALAVRREKRELGYATTTLSNKDITIANNVSALSAIEGKVAGANITSTTGAPGGSVSVVLRGDKSFTNSNQALLIVDGVIINNYDRTVSSLGLGSGSFSNLTQVDFGNSGNDIDPEDIENISVLTGSAAAALYGSIAANGAIMITTKQGNTNGDKKMHVTFKTSYTMQDILKYPDLQNQFGEGNVYQGIPNDPRENFSWGLGFDGQMRPWGQIVNGQQLVKPYAAQPDNYKDFFNTAKIASNYLSISGGDNTTNYFLSLNTVNDNGVVPNTFYNKYSIRFNGNTQLTHTIYSSVDVNYVNLYSKAEAQGQSPGSIYQDLLLMPRDIPIQELKNYNAPNYPWQGFGILDPSGVQRYGYYGAYTNNPYWVANNFNNYDRVDRIIGGFTLGIKPAGTNLNIYDRIGVDVAADRTTYEGPAFNYSAYESENPLYNGIPHFSPGYLLESNLNAMQLNNDVIIDYRKNLSDKINIDVLGGQNMRIIKQTNLIDDIDPSSNGLIVPGFYSVTNRQGPLLAYDPISEEREIGIYGDVKVNYRRTLYLEMTARNDWTSTLVPGNWSYFYPSINASWVFTEGWNSKFTQNILDFGKLRGGYSSVGGGALPYANNNPGYVPTNVGTAFGSVAFPFGGIGGYQIQNAIGDSALRPERTNEEEIGADLGFFHDRFTFSITAYNSLTIDEIVPVPIAISSGFATQEINLGSVQNSGIEMSARVTPIRTSSGFRWDLFGTFTSNKSMVKSLANGLSEITIGGFNGMAIEAAVGKPFGAFYATDITRNAAGQVVIDPSTGLPIPTSNIVYEGTYQPKFIASWGTDLSYKGLSLHLLFTTKQGGVYYSQTRQLVDFDGTASETAYNNRNPYIWPNSVYQNSAGQYVKNTQYKFLPYNYYANEIFSVPGYDVIDASYIKLQEAALYYTLPGKAFGKRTPFSSLQVGVFGENLLIWTPRVNQFDDPEENSGGGVTNEQSFNFDARPSLRSFGASLKVVF